MATTTARQSKPPKKGVPEPARRPAGAWNGARASPTFSSGNNPSRPTNGPPPSSQGPFPALSQTNGTPRSQDAGPQDRTLQSISGLTGTTITLLTKTGQHYEGVVASTNAEGDTIGVSLKDVKEISNPGAPLKDSLFIASTNIDTWSSGPADAKVPNGDTFRTDADISQKSHIRQNRELLAWQPDADATGGTLNQGDELAFGLGTGNAGWNQFETNEKLFGVKTSFDESVYTTKLDRSGVDFKERERKAQQIANEIIGAATNNPHIAEERNMVVDDSGVNEEDKYGAVVRGTNAYVPPGARKHGVTSPTTAAPVPKAEIPKVSINAPDGASVPTTQGQTPPASSKAPSPAPSLTNSVKPPADAVPAFRDFVVNERNRLNKTKQALMKNDMDKRMAELVEFSQKFKFNKPVPDDLVPILAKDEEKQKQIREKSSKAASAQARSTASNNSSPKPGVTQPSVAQAPVTKATPEPRKGSPAVPGTTKPATSKVGATPAAATKTGESAKKPPVSMVIQAIPPFKGGKSRSPVNAGSSTTTNTSNGTSRPAAASGSSATPSTAAAAGAPPMSPISANRLNVNASSFRPNLKANAFTPANPSSQSSVASASVSPKGKPAESSPSPTPNPFFGTRVIKKNGSGHIRDEFNPFKHNKVVDAAQVSAMWPYNGKRYMLLFPPAPHPQQQSPHLAPPVPPPMPPTYGEDGAAPGYVYAYPPYAYPGQPMMPGMAPPGPPGAYMPGPFMQPMGYPPGMPPNGQPMYASPSMGQMPPPQAYMPPPPPGTYPPPPNGAPRPSMPPTPIPAHAHPYYHQSPQLQHAVPYPMMMPPPAPNGPPGHNPYEAAGPAPPVQMGGVGHA